MFHFDTGAIALHQDKPVRIIFPVLADQMLVEREDGGGDAYSVPIAELKPRSEDIARESPARTTAIMRATPEDWARIGPIARIIWPILDAPRGHATRLVQAAARELDVDPATVWRWCAQVRNAGYRPTGLLRLKPGPQMNQRETDRSYEILRELVEEHYSTPEKPTIEDLYRKYRRRCRQEHARILSRETVRKFVRGSNQRLIAKRRLGRRMTDQLFRPVEGHAQHANEPLGLVMIDHTLADLNITDEKHRKSIGCFWLTLAIDVYTRCVWAYHVSLHNPRVSSLALAMAQGLMPKDELMKRLRIKGRWPVYGPPKFLSFDGAKEFKAPGFQRGCSRHGVLEAKARPPGRPRRGAIIERLIGTMMGRIRMLRGGSRKTVAERKDYDSNSKAQYTLAEIDRWVALSIEFYHRKIHSHLGEPPVVFYEREILKRGRLPAFPENRHQLEIDFMPVKTRSVHLRGIKWGRWYWGQILQEFIDKGLPQDVEVRRDDRVWNIAYVALPDGSYAPIQTSSDRPDSVESARRAKKYLQATGREVYEQSLDEADEQLEQHDAEVAEKSKKARRRQQIRQLNNEAHAKAVERVGPSKGAHRALPPPRSRLKKPFSDIRPLNRA